MLLVVIILLIFFFNLSTSGKIIVTNFVNLYKCIQIDLKSVKFEFNFSFKKKICLQFWYKSFEKIKNLTIVYIIFMCQFHYIFWYLEKIILLCAAVIIINNKNLMKKKLLMKINILLLLYSLVVIKHSSSLSHLD